MLNWGPGSGKEKGDFPIVRAREEKQWMGDDFRSLAAGGLGSVDDDAASMKPAERRRWTRHTLP